MVHHLHGLNLQTLVQWTRDSKVWYVQENEQGQFEVYFGDGVIGAGPLDGDKITISYLVRMNNMQRVLMTDTIGGNLDVTRAQTYLRVVQSIELQI